MNSYFVTLLSVAHSSNPRTHPLYEETFLLVRAQGEDEARQRAEKHGRQSAPSYESVTREQINWQFLEVIDATVPLS